MIKLNATLLATLTAASVNTATVDPRIIETIGLHSDMMDFDYYKNIVAGEFGLARTASLVNNAHNEVKNSILVGSGGLIRGSPLADYVSAKGLKAGDVHPVYEALNVPNYIVGTLGNHEFGYGLDYPKNALVGTKFPYVNADVIDAKTKRPTFTLYLIKDIEVVDKDGKKQTLKIGYIDVMPPQIIGWDKANLSGRVTVSDATGAMRRYMPEVRKKGAGVVVILAHFGLSVDPHKVMAENSVYYLSEIPGANAIIFGHAHAVFPGKNFADIRGADTTKGMLNDVPVVIPGMRGDHLGAVGLQLSNDSGKRQMAQAEAGAQPIYDIANRKSLAVENSKLVEALKADHDATRQLVSKPVDKSADSMYSYLVLMQDDPAVQVVDNVQKAYVEHYIQGDPDLIKLPALSAAAPFRVGGHKNDLASHMKVGKGQLTFRNAANLYLYLNTLIMMKASSKEVEEWLEYSAGQSNRIDPSSMKP